ncbi:MAG: hypothetical protein KTR32_25000 [Granulosicoccus sp.]|nr:hypothetical protein [Granulosicoccus sp.]
MSSALQEFVYKMPGVAGGNRPGAHRSKSRGAGMSFIAHARLFDQPDPRRLDLRASVLNLHGDWLVRSYLQRSSIAIKAIVDVSESMRYGSPGKLQVAADFLQSLGQSAYGYGDAVSLLAFDHKFREDLFLPARTSRANGLTMATRVLESACAKHGDAAITGFSDALERVSGSSGLVFAVSDFHWPIDQLTRALDKLSTAVVVPLVIWDQSEIVPPPAGQWVSVNDIKSRRKRHLWMKQRTRDQWIDNIRLRRTQLCDAFEHHNCIPIFLNSRFDADILSRYFMEKVA